MGTVSGLYKNCSDSNSCTIDSCSNGKCNNTLKCDGSTCTNGSADFIKYCAPTVMTPVNQSICGNGTCESTSGETNANCPADCKINTVNSLSVSFFAKKNFADVQWQKSAEGNSNSQIYFMISLVNNSTAQIDNVNVSANIPAEISSLGNLKLNGTPISGDIVSGVNIGSITPTSTKSITFEGKTQAITASATKQATAIVNMPGTSAQSDSVSINFKPGQTSASASVAPATSGFWDFLKKWYLWILAAVVLAFLFIIVFRRLSSET